jgi:hypothetical protein
MVFVDLLQGISFIDHVVERIVAFSRETALFGQCKMGKSNRILLRKITNEMLTPVMNDVGMGFFLDRDNPGQFGHGGADDGFQALLTMNADTGTIPADINDLSATSPHGSDFGQHAKLRDLHLPPNDARSTTAAYRDSCCRA